jgi:hypothetical protein
MKNVAFVFIVVIATACVSAPDDLTDDKKGLYKAGRHEAFLTPFRGSLFLSPEHPQVREACRHNARDEECPKFLRFGGAAGPGPYIPPALTSGARDLFITFMFTEITNTLVAGEGIGHSMGPNIAILHFEFETQFAGFEDLYNHNWSGAGDFLPGTTWYAGYPVVWGFIPDGCVSPPPVIPVNFRHTISLLYCPEAAEAPGGCTEAETIGSFEGVDDTSLVPTGFWNIQYTIHGVASNADASDFQVRGWASLVCSNL